MIDPISGQKPVTLRNTKKLRRDAKKKTRNLIKKNEKNFEDIAEKKVKTKFFLVAIRLI